MHGAARQVALSGKNLECGEYTEILHVIIISIRRLIPEEIFCQKE
jgi:hypothetical protein